MVQFVRVNWFALKIPPPFPFSANSRIEKMSVVSHPPLSVIGTDGAIVQFGRACIEEGAAEPSVSHARKGGVDCQCTVRKDDLLADFSVLRCNKSHRLRPCHWNPNCLHLCAVFPVKEA